MTSGFDQLERELLAATRRMAEGTRPRRHRSRRTLPSTGALAVASTVAVAIMIMVGAVTLAGGRGAQVSRPAGRGVHTSRPAGRSPEVQALVAELGILRQPQTAAARAFNKSKYARRAMAPQHHLVPGLTRLVRLPFDGKLYIYVEPSISRGSRYGFGFTELNHGAGGGECCITARGLRLPSGPGPAVSGSGPHRPQQYFEIVPDGVTRVRWVFPRHRQVPPNAVDRQTEPALKPLTVTVAVHDNVAAVRLPQRGTVTRDTWFAADGRVIATYTAPHRSARS
jgi:hypothetical protein